MGKKKSSFVQQKEGKRLQGDNFDPASRLRPVKEARTKEETLVKVKTSLPYSSTRQVPGSGATLMRRPGFAVQHFYQEHTPALIAHGVQTLEDLTLFVKVRYSPAYHVPKRERGQMDLPCHERKLMRDIARYYVTPPKLPWSNNVREAYTRRVRDFIKSGENQLLSGCVSLDVARDRRNQAEGNLVGYDSLRRPRVSDTALRRSQLNGSNGEATGKDDVAPDELLPAPCQHPWCNGIIVVSGNHRYYIIPHLGNAFLQQVYYLPSPTHVSIDIDDDLCERDETDDCFCHPCIVASLHNLHSLASQINGANGEATGTDDLHMTHSQLSGSHGEWTNGDDMERNNAARRVNREARNHANQRRIPNGRRDPDDQAERPAGQPRAVAAVAEVAIPPIPVVEPIVTRYIESMGSIYIDGVLMPAPGELTVAGGVAMENVVENGDGFIKTQLGKGHVMVTAPILAEVTIPAYTTFTDSFPSADYVVFYPLLRLLQRQLAGKQSTNTPFACSALAQKNYPRVPMTECAETIQYFIHLNEYTSAQVLRGNNLMRRMLGMPVEPGTLMANQVSELQLVRGELAVSPREFVRAPAGACAALDNYPLRTDFIVIRAIGTSWDGLVRQTPTLLDDGYFGFDTPDAAARWYRTQLFTFNGLGQEPFVHYDNTGHNAAKGLKRLVGARVDQVALQASQQTLIAVLHDVLTEGCTFQMPDTTRNYRDMLRVVATDITGVTERHGRRLEPLGDHEDEVLPLSCQAYGRAVFDCVQREVARLHSKMIHQTCRSTMQRLLDQTCDAGLVLKDYLYDVPFKALTEYFSPDQQRYLNAEVPHNRRDLRRSYVKGVLTHLDEDIMTRRLDALVKNETAKFGKASRLYVSYGAGAMYSNELPDYLKKCIVGWYHLGTINGLTGDVCLVSSSKKSALTALFDAAFSKLSLPNSYLAIAWSDDMNEFANLGGELYGANTDIESNDSSNGAYVFGVYGTCLANFNPLRAGGILRQCMEPVTLRNPSNAAEVLKVGFIGPIQGSGTSATTGLNNINSTGTCVATFTYLAHSPRDKEGFEHAIRAGAAACGHTKSIEWCDRDGCFSTQKIQFLKHSPLLCTRGNESRTHMVQNLGCIFRNFGKIDGDLTAAMLGVTPLEFSTGMSDDERADRFFSAVISGYKNSPSCPVLKALRSRFCYGSATQLPVKYRQLEDDEDLSDWTVATEELLERYGFTEAELSELVDLISRTRVGYAYTCSAMAKIYSVDYGVPL